LPGRRAAQLLIAPRDALPNRFPDRLAARDHRVQVLRLGQLGAVTVLLDRQVSGTPDAGFAHIAC